jgi:hypothetical protein
MSCANESKLRYLQIYKWFGFVLLFGECIYGIDAKVFSRALIGSMESSLLGSAGCC